MPSFAMLQYRSSQFPSPGSSAYSQSQASSFFVRHIPTHTLYTCRIQGHRNVKNVVGISLCGGGKYHLRCLALLFDIPNYDFILNVLNVLRSALC